MHATFDLIQDEIFQTFGSSKTELTAKSTVIVILKLLFSPIIPIPSDNHIYHVAMFFSSHKYWCMEAKDVF